MFLAAAMFNQPIGQWDMSNVTNRSDLFHYVSAFNQPIEEWNVHSMSRNF
jgi:hypothetical protein